MIGDTLSSGAHATIDAVGSGESITDCLRITRPQRPGRADGHACRRHARPDGSLASRDRVEGGLHLRHRVDARRLDRRTFDLAVDTANHFEAERLLSATYPLDDHVDAIAHAAAAGPPRRRQDRLRSPLMASITSAPLRLLGLCASSLALPSARPLMASITSAPVAHVSLERSGR